MLKGKVYYGSKSGVIPKNVMYKYESHDITYCHPGYHVKKYYVIVNNTVDKIIEDIIIEDSFHPNAWGMEKQQYIEINKPPKFSRFCSGGSIIGAKLITDTLMKKYQTNPSTIPNYKIYSDKYIRYMISQWGLDNPHHYPLRKHVTTSPPLPKEINNGNF